MEYLPTDDNYVTMIIGFGFLVFLLIIPLMTWAHYTKKPQTRKRLMKVIISSVVLVFVSGAVVAGINNNKPVENFEANLSQKYEYNNIETQIRDYPHRNQRVNEVEGVFYASRFTPQKIVLNIDGVSEEFVIIQDRETNEPTLYDLPMDGKMIGDIDAIYPHSLRAETLLK